MFLQRLEKLKLLNQFAISNSVAFQKSIAPLLRALAINHLRSGKGPIAEGYRADLKAPGVIKAGHLAQQAKNGVWADYIVLAALAEKLDVNFVVEYQQSSMVLRASKQKNAPTVVLKNTANVFWDFKNTVHDGNCGFNAFAEALNEIAKPLLRAEKAMAKPVAAVSNKPVVSEVKAVVKSAPEKVANKPIPKAVSPQHFSLSFDQEAEAIKEQQAKIIARYQPAIEKVRQTGIEGQAAFDKYWHGLSDADKQKVGDQIAQDQLVALQVAKGDLRSSAGYSGGLFSKTSSVAREEKIDMPFNRSDILCR